MEGEPYWIATVSDEDGLHASDIVWGDHQDADDAYEKVSQDVRDASEQYGLPIQWHGPMTLPAAS